MSEFKTLFAAYGGDYATTMGRFMGNEGLYLRLLPKLFDDDSLPKLGAALEAGDLDTAFEAAHTLKGVAGNLGLDPLYTAVSDLVEPLRKRQAADYSALYQVVQTQFRRVEELQEQIERGQQG